MINVEDLMELKDRMKEYGQDAGSFLCHPDNCEQLYKYAEEMSGKSLEAPLKGLHLFGVSIFPSTLCPKDKIFILSKDMVDRMKETIGNILKGGLL